MTIYLKPIVPLSEFSSRFGFKRCKGLYGDNGCYYLCVATDSKMIFLSPKLIEVISWNDFDPRIHAKPNCRFRDPRPSEILMYEMIKADMIGVSE